MKTIVLGFEYLLKYLYVWQRWLQVLSILWYISGATLEMGGTTLLLRPSAARV